MPKFLDTPKWYNLDGSEAKYFEKCKNNVNENKLILGDSTDVSLINSSVCIGNGSNSNMDVGDAIVIGSGSSASSDNGGDLIVIGNKVNINTENLDNTNTIQIGKKSGISGYDLFVGNKKVVDRGTVNSDFATYASGLPNFPIHSYFQYFVGGLTKKYIISDLPSSQTDSGSIVINIADSYLFPNDSQLFGFSEIVTVTSGWESYVTIDTYTRSSDGKQITVNYHRTTHTGATWQSFPIFINGFTMTII